MNRSIVVLGSLNMDFSVRVERLPAAGETVLGGGFQMTPGGKGANQACAAGKLAGPDLNVRMAGRVGYDWFADHLKASLAAAGVDVSFVHGTRSAPTGVAFIWVDGQGQNSIVVAPGANTAVRAADMEGLRSVFRGAALALFQLETPLDAVRAALALARAEGAGTILDPAPAQPLPRDLLELVDILTPNETEAHLLLGREPSRIALEDAPCVADAVLALGPRSVILKLGDRGCFYRDSARSIVARAFECEPVDSTAAGDVFNGALAVALAEGLETAAALRFANAAAAISVTRAGAQSSVPARLEVDAFLVERSVTTA
ncbi:MAG TPA: ribokinase [Bryobacteraceae bacterium]|jgi:ribokinase|nr:ribokinase [Bryobacteraceae bacterium]